MRLARVYVFIYYFFYYFKAAIYGTNCVSFLIIHHTLLVCVHVVCMLVLVLASPTVEILGFHSHAYMPVYLQYIYVAMTTVGSEWHT